MKVNSTDRAVVLLETVDEGSHAIVPKLDGRGMERDEDPWSVAQVSVLEDCESDLPTYRLG